jgi:hypothetical protein
MLYHTWQKIANGKLFTGRWRYGTILAMYGYLDESGAPGVATNDNDFLVVSFIEATTPAKHKRD